MTVVWAYLGATIGAGFASGQEITQFFVQYGAGGLKGCLLASFLFALYGALLMAYAHKRGLDHYQALLRDLLGRQAGRLMDGLVSLFLFLGVGTMLSAAGAVTYEHLALPKAYGVCGVYLAVLGLLLRGRYGLAEAFHVFVPLKLSLLLMIGFGAIFQAERPAAEIAAVFSLPEGNHWLVAGLLYVAYNFVLALVVLIECKHLTSARNAVAGAWLGGILLGGLLLTSYLALSRYLPAVLSYETPMLYVSGQVMPGVKPLFVSALFMGVLTGALANSHGLSVRIQALTGWPYPLCLGTVLSLAAPLGGFDFSLLVRTVYPRFGFLGWMILGRLFIKGIFSLIQNIF